MQVHVIWHPESDALCRPIAEMIYLALNRDPYQPLLPGNPRHPLNAMIATGKPIILSTGMSTLDQIDAAVDVLGVERLVLLHATSTYPMPAEEANLRMIATLRDRFPGVPVGYSGHEPGLQISLAAAALGAAAIERHITLDRTMWGSDHAASLEPTGLQHLVRDIRIIEQAMGDGVKRIMPGELAPMAKLRRVPTA